MNILVLYALSEKKTRKTILDSLYCFAKYDQKNHYYFLDIVDMKSVEQMLKPNYQCIDLSAIIVHYSAAAQRNALSWWNKNKNVLIKLMQQYSCDKIIIPQDEYNVNNAVRELIREGGIQYIYTCAYEEDYEKLYPKELGYKHIETVFTGYIDENTLKTIQKIGYERKRNIDIGYRARKLPYWLGKHGQLKQELAEVFLDHIKDSDYIKCDIATTGETEQNTIMGDQWIKYLLDCRTVLGCLGGSGLLDADGSIAETVNKYCMNHPEASFEEVEEICFKGKDNAIHLFALSPRHFECAMTKTCQVLVEGDYRDVFKANIDYIELNRDFSNIEEVIAKIKNEDYCKKIAENCYNHVVLSGKYTYAEFVKHIVGNINNCEKKAVFLPHLWILCKKSFYYSIYPNLRYFFSRKSDKNGLHLLKEYFLLLLGKIFKFFEPYRDTAVHKALKSIWDKYVEKHDRD